MAFQEIKLEELDFNPFRKIGKEWMLISAGDEKKINTMTASWGGVGVLWGENVATAYIRPTRYTKKFVDEQERFSLSFFGGHYKKELNILGTVSGRDTDKIKDVNFHTTFLDGVPSFEEATLVFLVKKLYTGAIHPEKFLDPSLDEKWYPKKDYHDVYIGKIEKAYIQK